MAINRSVCLMLTCSSLMLYSITGFTRYLDGVGDCRGMPPYRLGVQSPPVMSRVPLYCPLWRGSASENASEKLDCMEVVRSS